MIVGSLYENIDIEQIIMIYKNKEMQTNLQTIILCEIQSYRDESKHIEINIK